MYCGKSSKYASCLRDNPHVGGERGGEGESISCRELGRREAYLAI